MDTEENNTEESASSTQKKKIYLPDHPLGPDEELVCDPSAYILLHEANTGNLEFCHIISIIYLQLNFVQQLS